MRHLISLLSALALSATLSMAAAAGGGGEKKKKGKGEEEKVSQIFVANFELPPEEQVYDRFIEPLAEGTAEGVDFRLLALPGVRDGELLGYYFTTIRLVVARDKNVWQARGKSHYLRDAVIRASHTTELVMEADGRSLDADKAEQAILQAVSEILGEGVVEDVIFVSIEDQI